MFEITKSFISTEITYCKLNEIKSKQFLKKSQKFNNKSFRNVIAKPRIIRSLFPLRDELCVIYKGGCSWDSLLLVKPNVMQNLDGIKIIIQLKI